MKTNQIKPEVEPSPSIPAIPSPVPETTPDPEKINPVTVPQPEIIPSPKPEIQPLKEPFKEG